MKLKKEQERNLKRGEGHKEDRAEITREIKD